MNVESSEITAEKPGEISKWLDDLQNNDEAAEALWHHFFPKLVGIAAPRMRAMPSKARDEEDVALSAMQSFFAAADAGQFDVKTRADLWRLLVTITIRKVTKEQRRQYAKKRGGGIEHIGNHSGKERDPINAIIDPGQMPEFVHEVHAQCNELLNSLPDEALRVTARMKLEGCSTDEICDLLQCKRHETKRRLKKIREYWRQFLPEKE